MLDDIILLTISPANNNKKGVKDPIPEEISWLPSPKNVIHKQLQDEDSLAVQHPTNFPIIINIAHMLGQLMHDNIY